MGIRFCGHLNLLMQSGFLSFLSFRGGTHFESGGAGFGVRSDVNVPTVAATKEAFLKALLKPIPSSYETAIQELLVQQHSVRYNTTYTYDPIFALGVVTVFNRLIEGYPSNMESQSIFEAYISALNEDPDLYRYPSFPLLPFILLENGISSSAHHKAMECISKPNKNDNNG